MKTLQAKANRNSDLPMIWLIYFCLIIYSVLVVINTGDIGFQGDDFWYLSAPFSHGFWQAFLNYVLPYDRPLGLVYVFFLFESFGFSRIPYLALDFFLQATTSLFFGIVLAQVFPQRRVLIFFSMLLSFFLLPSASSLYVMAMTVARLGCLIFWISIFMFQRWAQKPSWLRLLIPIALYCASFSLYDSTSLLILTVPLFVYPVWYRNQYNSEISFREMYTRLFAKLRLSTTGKINPFHQPEIIFTIRLAVGLLISIGLLFINLFIIFPFGASRIRSSSIDFSLIFDYMVAFLQYLIAPFSYASLDIWTWIICIFLVVFMLVILFHIHGSKQLSTDSFSGDPSWGLYAVLMGLALSLTGVFPFIIAQYGASLGFITHGRIFFSAIYGLAILLSVIVSNGRFYSLRWFLELVGVAVIAASAVFLADLRLDWRSAARINCTLWSSMVEQVPAVKKDTVFLFLDLQSYYQDGRIVPVGNRAAVFASVDALPLYLQMLYGDPSLKAYYLYPAGMETSLLQSEGRTATVTLKGVTARWSPELPKDKIVIMERQDNHLVFVDKLTTNDGKAAVVWKDGVKELLSNRDRIISADTSSNRFEIIWGNVCK